MPEGKRMISTTRTCDRCGTVQADGRDTRGPQVLHVVMQAGTEQSRDYDLCLPCLVAVLQATHRQQ